MAILDNDLEIAAAGHVPVMITCESAPQREQCARLIHNRSQGADRPFITFRGDEPLRHRFDQARGGTLFIPDIVVLSADAQLELLALLDESVWGWGERAVAVRILAGASRCLEVERRLGLFSARLFYRLNLIHLDHRVAESIGAHDLASVRQTMSR